MKIDKQICVISSKTSIICLVAEVLVLLQEDMRFSMNRITELEHTEFWAEKKSPEKEEDFLRSQFPMDIWTVWHCTGFGHNV